MEESKETDCNALQAAAKHGQDEISNLLTLQTESDSTSEKDSQNPPVLRNDGEL